MKVLLYGHKVNDTDIQYIADLYQTIFDAQHQLLIYKPYFKQINKKFEINQQVKLVDSYDSLKNEQCDILISLGGDGTILRAASLIRELNIPILGINLGRLGFLSNLDKTKTLNVLKLIEEKNYELDSRSLLSLETNSPIFGKTKFALNDFTLLKRDTSSMITIHAFVNDQFLNTYWADGLIISTPTGSTGYSLSCGGPIIFPSSKTFVITPVAPHTLTARPIIIPDDSKIRLQAEGRTDNFLCTLDARAEFIDSSVDLLLKKCDFMINLIRFQEQTFSQTIRDKLNWGIDSRN